MRTLGEMVGRGTPSQFAMGSTVGIHYRSTERLAKAIEDLVPCPVSGSLTVRSFDLPLIPPYKCTKQLPNP